MNRAILQKYAPPAIITAAFLLSVFLHGGFFWYDAVAPAALLFIASLFSLRRVEKRGMTVLLPLFLILVFFILSTLINDCDRASAFGGILKYSCLPLAVLAAFTVDKRLLPKIILAVSTATAVFGIFPYFKIFSIPDAVYRGFEEALPRLQSLVGYANTASVLLGCGVFAAIYLSRGKCGYLVALCGLLSSSALFLTWSKAGIALFLLVGFAYCVAERKITYCFCSLVGSGFIIAVVSAYLVIMRNSALAFVVFCIAAALLPLVIAKTAACNPPGALPPILLGAAFAGICGYLLYAYFTDGLPATLTARLVYYKDGLRLASDSLLLGIAPEAWETRQYAVQSSEYFVKYVHSGYIQLLLDGGIPALAAFAAAVTATFVGLIRKFKNSADRIYLFAAISLSFLLLHSAVDMDSSFASVLILTGVLMSLSVSAREDT